MTTPVRISLRLKASLQNTPDTEIELHPRRLGSWHVAPYGASLRGLSHAGAPVITRYTGAANGKIGGQGDVLIPFPGRVAGGKYAFAGTAVSDGKERQRRRRAPFTAFCARCSGTTTSASVGQRVTFHDDACAGRASRLSVRAVGVSLTYALSEAGLTTSFEIENTGDKPAPVAAGFHPYFTVGSALINTDTLHVPFASYLEFKRLDPDRAKFCPWTARSSISGSRARSARRC